MDLFSSPSVVGSQAAFSVHVCVLRVCVRAESSSQGQWCYFPAFLQDVQRRHCSLFIIDHHIIDLNVIQVSSTLFIQCLLQSGSSLVPVSC